MTYSVDGADIHFYPPVNWDESYSVVYEFRTSIITHQRGNEQRFGMRNRPRKRVEYSTLLEGQDLLEMERYLRFRQTGRAWHPDRSRHITLTTGLSGSVATVSGVPAWLQPGRRVFLIWQGRTVAVGVVSISGLNVTFDASPSGFPVGADVFPALSGWVEAKLDGRVLTDDKATFSVAFEVEVGEQIPYTIPAAPSVFNGREVFMLRPNWAQPLQISHDWPVDVLDYGQGRTFRYRPIEFGSRVTTMTFLGRNRVEADQIVNLYHRHRGQLGEFYLPTWQNDLVPTTDLLGTSTRMTVAGTRTAREQDEDTVYRAILLLKRNGQAVFRLVTAIDELDGESRLTFSQTWGTTITRDEILMVCWLPVTRLASDNLTIEWITDSVCQARMAFRSLESLTPEALA